MKVAHGSDKSIMERPGEVHVEVPAITEFADGVFSVVPHNKLCGSPTSRIHGARLSNLLEPHKEGIAKVSPKGIHMGAPFPVGAVLSFIW
jgi:hypothetical protein